MLFFLQQMHNRDRDRLERGQVAFILKAVHITEAGPDLHNASATEQQNTAAPEKLVETCNKAKVPLYVVPLEAVFLRTEQDIPLEGPVNMPHARDDLQSLCQVKSPNTCSSYTELGHPSSLMIMMLVLVGTLQH